VSFLYILRTPPLSLPLSPSLLSFPHLLISSSPPVSSLLSRLSSYDSSLVSPLMTPLTSSHLSSHLSSSCVC
jgi:hypothetical protein